MSSFLSAAQLAAMRVVKAADHNASVDIYRAPTTSGGKKSAVVLLTAAVACRIWPGAQANRLMQTLPELSMVRYDAIAFFLDSADVQRGDEVRDGTTRYEVVGQSTWRTTNVCALQRVVTV